MDLVVGGCALYTEQKLDSYMKKLFTALLFTSFCVLANSQSLTPLSAWMKERPNWQNDKSELAYFTLRCNVFLKFVGAYFIARSDKQAGIDRGKQIESDSDVFVLPALAFGDATGYKTNDVLARGAKIQKEYVNQISKNKDLTNSIFEGYVGDDFKICTDAVADFRFISEEIKKSASKAK
jgi:hypothetical protein